MDILHPLAHGLEAVLVAAFHHLSPDISSSQPFPPLPYPCVSGNATEIKTPANKVLNVLFAVREEQLHGLIPTYNLGRNCRLLGALQINTK